MKAIRINEKYKENSILEEDVILECTNGECYLNANNDVFGIQLHFSGVASITPTLPEGWIMQGNNNKIIIFTLQNTPIQNQLLFTYKGVVKLNEAIICNKEAKLYNVIIKKQYTNWGSQSFDFSVDTTSWEDYKDTKRVGKVKKTTYNLPDYDIPTVEKKTKIKRTQASSRSTGGY